MPKSLSLALYLATKARADRAAKREETGKPLSDLDKTRDAERSGEYVEARPKGPLIWFHTGHDPQASAIHEFVQRLRSERDDLNILLTTSSEKRLDSKPYLTSQLAPDENLPAIRRFLSYWHPNIAVWSEPDLRPALVTETAACGIPLLLADAQSARPDTQSRRWWRGMSATLLSPFQHVLTGDDGAAAGLRRLGADPSVLEIKGFLEEGTAALPCNETDRTALARAFGARPVWLAAHVTEAERAAAITAHRQAQRRAHRLLLIMVPEDPRRGPDWARQLAAEGQALALRSTGQEPDAQTQIYIADTEEEMGLWYRLAPISFLGQSLETKGGVNPFEAAALGSAILHGPHVDNHTHTYRRLASARASRAVNDAAQLGDAVEALLSPDVAAAMAHGAWQVCSSGSEVTDRVMDLIFTALDTRETV